MHRPIAIALLMLATPALAAENRIVGIVTHVVDGDTLDIGTVRVRLHGIDAPEHDQAGGTEAATVLGALVMGRELLCEPRGTSRKRVVARCMVEGRDVGESMARAGYALDWPRYSNGRYAPAERQAETARAGLWAEGQFMAPWLWRDRHGRGAVGPTRR